MIAQPVRPGPLWLGLGILALAATAVAGFAGAGSFVGNLFKLYAPREFCMAYETPVIWLHVLSDAGIALAYYSIPLALLYFVRRRRDLTFSWMFVCFALFIFACGTTHVMNIVAIWFAAYRVDGLIKFSAALVSIGTAAMLWPLIPKALALPSPAALRRANDELGREIVVRRQAEDSLRQMQTELEERVQTRTAELQSANDLLRQEVAARVAAEREREDLLARERVARAVAEEASRMKDEFLATLSHELRTPLSAISGWVHMLGQGENPPETVREGVGVIERNARTLTELIDDLLDMSRVVSGQLRLNVEHIDLAAVIDAALETVAPAARAKDLVVARVIDPASLPVAGDPARLQQVVWNLVNNAIKFTPRGGQVQVLLERREADMCITVSDTGVGIAEEFLPFVFERFRQGDASTTRRHGGLGLGLAIVRHLVELHGGTVQARSAGVGKGATFVVRLPFAPAPAPLPRQVPARSEPARLTIEQRFEPVTVLLVDDEADTREVIRRILEQSGSLVVTAGDADEAIAVLQEKRPTILLSDIGMPGQDGYTLIRRVRKLPPERGGLVPAVALTAFARSEDRMRALAAGYQMHLAKPVDPNELIVVLNSLIRRPLAPMTG